jgi:hypothetical protein
MKRCLPSWFTSNPFTDQGGVTHSSSMSEIFFSLRRSVQTSRLHGTSDIGTHRSCRKALCLSKRSPHPHWRLVHWHDRTQGFASAEKCFCLRTEKFLWIVAVLGWLLSLGTCATLVWLVLFRKKETLVQTQLRLI